MFIKKKKYLIAITLGVSLLLSVFTVEKNEQTFHEKNFVAQSVELIYEEQINEINIKRLNKKVDGENSICKICN